MLVKLMNYAKEFTTEATLPDDYKERKAIVTITVIYGDEVLHINYGDGDIEIDRADWPIWDDAHGYDGYYDIYNPDEGINLLDDPEWLSRTDSYQFLW